MSSKQLRPFHTVLVANRGEIALRVMRTLRRLGLGAVAVYSEADRDSPHVRAADRAVCIGPAPPAQSYLHIAALLEAARRAGADAIHPGYGFLAENADFADAVDAVGLVFIGPNDAAIRAMGHKAQAKRLMQAAGMPCIPGHQGEDQSEAALVQAAREIGFPLMVKAAAGGGGRGMRLVHEAAALPAALASARSEASAAFGSGELLLERAVLQARHVEIQVLADSHGHCIHLGERDCSVQRRHQKIIEEAPSPAVSESLRARMGEAAVKAAQSIGYIGVGTLEFLLDQGGAFYFMEMNTRLQVEHAVTEALTGLDLVEQQLRVAAGERLALQQADVGLRGHAIELRLCAEDVAAGFLPQTGAVLRWRPPADALGVRVDHGLVEGGSIPPHYDAMVAKLVAHGRDRAEARRKLERALAHCVLLGLPSNHGFLADCLADPVFAEGSGVHTGFVTQQFGERLAQPAAPGPHTLAFAAMAALEPAQSALGTLPAQCVLALAGRRWHCRLQREDAAWRVLIQPQGGQALLALHMAHLCWEGQRSVLRAECDGLTQAATLACAGDTLHLFHAGRAWTFERVSERRQRGAEAAGGEVSAPLTGRVLSLAVADGQQVAAGQALLVIEAMKMEHVITAPRAGRVAGLSVKAGGQAARGQVLLRIAPDA